MIYVIMFENICYVCACGSQRKSSGVAQKPSTLFPVSGSPTRIWVSLIKQGCWLALETPTPTPPPPLSHLCSTGVVSTATPGSLLWCYGYFGAIGYSCSLWVEHGYLRLHSKHIMNLSLRVQFGGHVTVTQFHQLLKASLGPGVRMEIPGS